MVTSYDMIENEMGYCGSKSRAIALVKEQRVDGSYSLPTVKVHSNGPRNGVST